MSDVIDFAGASGAQAKPEPSTPEPVDTEAAALSALRDLESDINDLYLWVHLTARMVLDEMFNGTKEPIGSLAVLCAQQTEKVALDVRTKFYAAYHGGPDADD